MFCLCYFLFQHIHFIHLYSFWFLSHDNLEIVHFCCCFCRFFLARLFLNWKLVSNAWNGKRRFCVCVCDNVFTVKMNKNLYKCDCRMLADSVQQLTCIWIISYNVMQEFNFNTITMVFIWYFFSSASISRASSNLLIKIRRFLSLILIYYHKMSEWVLVVVFFFCVGCIPFQFMLL